MKWTQHFETWWDRIIAARLAEGRPWLTVNAEFGPRPYQPVDPRDDTPLADVWDVCLWMTQPLRARWARCAVSGPVGAGLVTR